MHDSARTRWIIETAIEPDSAADAERVARSLAQFASEDPTFGYVSDSASTTIIVMGTDESNLEAHLAALRRIHGDCLRAGTPQVRYREAFARGVDVDYTHKRQTGAGGEFARVRLRIEPSEPGTGSVFRSEIVGGVVPEEHVGGVEQGVRRVCDTGVLAGFPIDAVVSLCGGAYHEIDSSWAAFEIAGRHAMQQGAREAGMMLLEPIMAVEVETPPELAGAVMADMDNRRIGIIEIGGRTMNLCIIVITEDAIVITGDAPLARLLGYAEALRSISDGGARCTISFSRYAEVPRDDGPDTFAPAIGMRA